MCDFENLFDQESVNITQFLKLEFVEGEHKDQINTISDLKRSIAQTFKNVIQWHVSWDLRKNVEDSVNAEVDRLFEVYISNQKVAKDESITTETRSLAKQQCQIFSLKRRKQKRGPYKHYPSNMKEQALLKLNEGQTIRNVCQEMHIPKKNLKRWIDIGAERKKGGGRKRMDEQLEKDLFEWCITEGIHNGRPVSRKMIRTRALQLTKFPNKFKASKGWTDKFVKKFNLRKRVVKELQDMGLYKRNKKLLFSEMLKQEDFSVKINEQEEDDDFQQSNYYILKSQIYKSKYLCIINDEFKSTQKIEHTAQSLFFVGLTLSGSF